MSLIEPPPPSRPAEPTAFTEQRTTLQRVTETGLFIWRYLLDLLCGIFRPCAFGKTIADREASGAMFPPLGFALVSSVLIQIIFALSNAEIREEWLLHFDSAYAIDSVEKILGSAVSYALLPALAPIAVLLIGCKTMNWAARQSEPLSILGHGIAPAAAYVTGIGMVTFAIFVRAFGAIGFWTYLAMNAAGYSERSITILYSTAVFSILAILTLHLWVVIRSSFTARRDYSSAHSRLILATLTIAALAIAASLVTPNVRHRSFWERITIQAPRLYPFVETSEFVELPLAISNGNATPYFVSERGMVEICSVGGMPGNRSGSGEPFLRLRGIFYDQGQPINRIIQVPPNSTIALTFRAKIPGYAEGNSQPTASLAAFRRMNSSSAGYKYRITAPGFDDRFHPIPTSAEFPIAISGW